MSKFFQPFDVIPHNQERVASPSEDSVSARLMTSYGVVRQAGPGTFHLLPLGLRAMTKLERIIDTELQRVGCLKMSMPHVTQGHLWGTSGRLASMGPELVTFRDRHQRTQVLSPTHEEAVTDILRSLPVTHERDLPVKLYQIGAKFRDEMKPRFGMIRANEFTMQDLYTFDKDIESAETTYREISEAYRVIFDKLGVPWVRVAGDSGQMGGSRSHEYHFPAAIGEDTLLINQETGEGHNQELLATGDTVSGQEFVKKKGIEVGHTFLLGDKYSRPAGAKFKTDQGKSVPHQMGCYGIGVSRVLAASLEVLSTQTELRWPEAIAPFSLAILAPKGGSKEAEAGAGLLQEICQGAESLLGEDVMLDDRAKLTVGKKLREAKKTGYPFIILFGKKCLDQDPMLELYIMQTGEVVELRPIELLEILSNKFKNNGTLE